MAKQRNRVAFSSVRRPPTVYNNTDRSLNEIEALPKVGHIRNNWREREVSLHASPQPDLLYMIGRSFDGCEVIVTLEAIGLNEKAAMDYWVHGEKLLIRD